MARHTSEPPHSWPPVSSSPPSIPPADRELLLRELKAVSDRLAAVERQAAKSPSSMSSQFRLVEGVKTDVVLQREAIDGLREAFDALSRDVRGIIDRDVETAQEFGKLSTQVALLVQMQAAHSGGQVGALTGSAAGTESARDENKSHTARNTVITMALSSATAITIALISTLANPPKPTPPGANVDTATADKLERLELEVKRLRKDAGP
jgi:hypothetical protein